MQKKNELSKKFINFRPMLFIALSLCLGIVSSYNFFVGNILVGVLLCLAFLLVLVIVLTSFIKRKHLLRSAIFLPIMLLFFVLGISGTLLQINNYQSANLGNHYYKIDGKIEQKNLTDYGNKFVLSDVFVDGNVKGKLHYKVEVYSFGYSDLEIGDRIYFESYLMDKELYYNGNFSFYAIEDNVKYSVRLSAKDIYYLESDPNVFQKVNLFLKENLQKGMGGDRFSIAYAMICGNSDYMDIETLTTYRQAGVAHIFAVSGLHVGFIAGFLSFIFNKLRINKLLKAIFITLATLFYAGVCGFSSSSLRAAIMVSVSLFCSLGGNKYDGISSISVAGIILLICSPIRLFCVGFQLSFAVVLGLLILSPPISRLLKFLPWKLNEKVASVLAAQIAGIPICLAAFGQFSFIAIIVNLIFIPIVSVVFVLTIALTILGGLLGIPVIALFLPDKCFLMMNLLITAFDYDIFMIGGFSLGIFSLVYFALAVVPSGFINLTKKIKAITSVILSIVLTVGGVCYNAYLNNQSSIIVCGSSGMSCTVIKNPDKNVMIISDATNSNSNSRLKTIAVGNGVEKIDHVIFAGGYDVDVFAFISGLKEVFELSEITCCGEDDEDLRKVFVKNFPNYSLSFASDYEKLLNNDDFCIIPSRGGRFFDVRLNGKSIAIFGSFDKGNFDYTDVEKQYDLAILLHEADRVEQLLTAKEYLRYRYALGKLNAESMGNVIIKV